MKKDVFYCVIKSCNFNSFLIETKALTSLEKQHRVFASKEPIRIQVTVF